MFHPGTIGALIPIVAILTGMLAIWTTHQRKMRQMELNAQRGGSTTTNDISPELASAIKEEFARLRADNAELKARIDKIEQQNTAQSGQLSQTQLAEIAKQVQAMQTHS